jgi:hypothetical protein
VESRDEERLEHEWFWGSDRLNQLGTSRTAGARALRFADCANHRVVVRIQPQRPKRGSLDAEIEQSSCGKEHGSSLKIGTFCSARAKQTQSRSPSVTMDRVFRSMTKPTFRRVSTCSARLPPPNHDRVCNHALSKRRIPSGASSVRTC